MDTTATVHLPQVQQLQAADAAVVAAPTDKSKKDCKDKKVREWEGPAVAALGAWTVQTHVPLLFVASFGVLLVPLHAGL